MIDPLFIYEVVDGEGKTVAGPYRRELDAQNVLESLCYDMITVFPYTTEEEILEKFRKSKKRVQDQENRHSIVKIEVF